MSKDGKQRSFRGQAGKPLWLPWLLAAAGLVLLGGAILASILNGGVSALRTGNRAPRMAVDQAIVDYGQVKIDTPIEAVFRVQNIGDATLEILGVPQGELREGC